MSKGSPIVPIRIPAELLALVDEQIASSNTRRGDEPWTRSAFIIAAIKEKLDKMERSRKSKKK